MTGWTCVRVITPHGTSFCPSPSWWTPWHTAFVIAAVWALAAVALAAFRRYRCEDRMPRADCRAWASARSVSDLGERVIGWLHGDIKWTPGHCGPPCDETIPLIPALEILNRGGFVTDNSQLAETVDGRAWNAWVSGWADDATLARIRAATAGTGLIAAACRRTSHECDRMPSFWFCPWHDSVCFWSDRCPAMGSAFSDLWYVNVEDPEPGRNDLLWLTLVMAFGAPCEVPS